MSIYYLYPPPSRYPTTSIRGHAFPTAAATGGIQSSLHSSPLQPLLHVLHDLAHPAAAAHDVRAPAVDIRETATRYYIDVELPGVVPGDYSVRWIDEEGGAGARLLLVEAELRRRRVPEEEEEEEEESGRGAEKGGEGGLEAALGSSLHRVRSHEGDDLCVARSSGSDEERAGVPPVTPAKKARTRSLSAAWAAVRPRAFLLLHAAATEATPTAPAAASSPPPPPPSSPPDRQQPHQQPDPAPGVRSLARERRVGTLARAFRFHAAVDRAGLRARLDQGVLSLVVPKTTTEGAGTGTGTGRQKGAGGVDSVAVRRRRAAGSKEAGGGTSIQHGAHHWTLAWPGPARHRVASPRDWGSGLMNAPGYYM